MCQVLNYLFKIGCAVFAQRTDIILGEFLPFIDISAYLAYPAFLAFGLRLRLDIVLIVGIGHGISVADNSCLRNGTDKHSVGTKVNIILNFKRHNSVDILAQYHKPIVGTGGF